MNIIQKVWRKIFPDPLLQECKETEHAWRPCVVHSITYNEYKPAKICDICQAWRPLTQEQFFAEFGESFYAAAARSTAVQ